MNDATAILDVHFPEDAPRVRPVATVVKYYRPPDGKPKPKPDPEPRPSA